MALAAKLYFFVFCSQTSPKRFFDTLSLIFHLYKFSTKKKKRKMNIYFLSGYNVLSTVLMSYIY